MDIDADFDGGNIDVLERAARGATLAIRGDTNAEFRQWFHFMVRNGTADATLRITNAGETTYPDAWEGYRACVSIDDGPWHRTDTTFDGETLTLAHRGSPRVVRYAYFAPYAFARHEAMLARADRAAHVTRETIARSVQGRNVDVLRFGDWAEDRPTIWVTARQHPGETMAEWFADGLVRRLLDVDDDVTRAVLARATVYVVPNMNPDGGVVGNLRANAAGMNLNRAWLEPDEERSPEVLGVRARMHETGVDLMLDVHGDERNPYCFLAGCEGNPSYDDRIRFLENLFEQSLVEFDDDFQDEYGYDRDEPGGGDLSTAANYVGETFNCLAYTVEMPFKDAANHPDPARGWTPERAGRLGAAALESIAVCLDSLRAE